MRRNNAAVLMLLVCMGLSQFGQTAELIPINAFLDGTRIQQVSISPDGHYLALIVIVKGRYTVLVQDRNTGNLKVVLGTDPDKRIDPSWCGWANTTRVLCGFRGVAAELGEFFPYSRLVGVNADGTEMKVLYQQQAMGGMSTSVTSAQFQDEVIDWTPDDPNTVLMSIDTDADTFPSVFEVNVYTGKRRGVLVQHEPIRAFATDGRGNVRLGWGFKNTKLSYFAKLDGEKNWRLLAKTEAFSNDASVFTPVAVIPGTNFAYATKSDGDREALWKIDLEDKREPEVVFEHPLVDVGGTVFSPSHALLGVSYETDRPAIYYTDETVRSYIAAIDKLLPNTFNEIVDITRDESAYIVRSASDVQPPVYYVLAKQNAKLLLTSIGSSYPELLNRTLAPIRSISYPAQDGTSIPGYLTVPVGTRPEHLPLIVLPHGGPIARDSWGFDWLLQFLVSRGYAVLQMNFRGSDGYGQEWFRSAHQDWGGLTYSDITAGTRWAIAQGIADPKRICIVGWSFGGYAALLGATRNSELYRCAASIAGVSDLPEMLFGDEHFVNIDIERKQVGTESVKLKEDSPRRHAEGVNIPILMIHGDHDYTVGVNQTHLMESALKKQGKRFKTVIIKDADHQLAHDSDRLILFNELEAFLKAELGPSAQ